MMRNDNLKNELNNLPQDLDREQLWASIDLPKKKRKRRGFFWMYFSSAILLGVILLSWFNLVENPKPQPYSDEKQLIVQKSDINSEIEKDQARLLSGSNDVRKDEAFQNKIISTETKNASTSERKEQKNEGSSNNDNSNFTPPLLNKNRVTSELRRADVKLNDISKETDKIIDDNITSDQSIFKNKDVTLSNQEITPPSNLSNIKTHVALMKIIQPLPQIAFGYLETDKILIDDQFDISIPKSYHDSPFTFGISVFSLIGKSNLNFENGATIANRQKDEKSLEAISFGLLGQFRFNNLELYSGFSITRHNTHLNASVQKLLILDNLQNLVQRKVNTQYSLYNSYQYIDLNVGVGYRFPLGQKWALIPSMQVGYSLNFDADGGIVSEDDQLTELAELMEYSSYSKWQGQANLKISRVLNDNWEIGLISFLTTRKSLGSFEDYTHSVSSYGVGLSISRLIK